MGADAQIGVTGEGPVLHVELQGPLRPLDHAPIAGGFHVQPRLMVCQAIAELLHTSGGGHFLQATTRSGGGNGFPSL